VSAAGSAPPAAPIACRLCGASSLFCGRRTLLGRHDVAYHRCTACDLIQTEAPYWLDEAYSKAIAALDTGAISRNRITARLTLALAYVLGLPRGARCLDWGGGHGVLTRMMRDFGLDYFWCDRYAENLYARGFEGDPQARHDLVTAFETFEHLADVRAELDALFAPRHPFVLVGTLLHDGFRPDWWYLGTEAGQHIAFYAQRTMRQVAAAFDYTVEPGPEYSLFVAREAPLGRVRRALSAQAVRHARVSYALGAVVPDVVLEKMGPYRSKTQSDHRDQVTGGPGGDRFKPSSR
jgi:hypothetical protein